MARASQESMIGVIASSSPDAEGRRCPEIRQPYSVPLNVTSLFFMPRLVHSTSDVLRGVVKEVYQRCIRGISCTAAEKRTRIALLRGALRSRSRGPGPRGVFQHHSGKSGSRRHTTCRSFVRNRRWRASCGSQRGNIKQNCVW